MWNWTTWLSSLSWFFFFFLVGGMLWQLHFTLGLFLAACLVLYSGHNAVANERKNDKNYHVVYLHLLAEKANDSFYGNRRQLIEMTTKGSLPMEAVDMEPEPSNPYSPPRQLSAKQNGHKYKSPKSRSSQSLSYSSNTAVSPGGLRPWDSKDTLGLRHSYGTKKLCIIEKELHTTRYLPPQPYFVTNSKTEVTVWGTDKTSDLKRVCI